jgi:large subunit ribosomal protein L10
MQRTQKERVVTELAEQLRSTESLIVADYRGLTNAQLEELRAKLRGSGARFQVVKNTLTRRAAEEVGSESLLALLEGPTAIAFVETDGDPVAVAKALSDTARDTKVLTLRGGLLAGSSIDAEAIEALAKLPAPEVVKAQLVGVIVAPLTGLVSLLAAPVRDLVGLIDARIVQLEEGGDASATEAPAAEAAPQPEAEAAAEVVAEDAELETEEPQAAAEPEATAEEPAESTEESEPTAAPSDTESEE